MNASLDITIKQKQNDCNEKSSEKNFLTNYFNSYKTDRYMGGIIKPEKRQTFCECGGKFINKILNDFNNSIPVCELCNSTPKLFRIRITLPNSPKKDIRYSFEGHRLVKASLADATLTRIRDEIKSGKFDPILYLPKKGKENLLFKNFAPYYSSKRDFTPEGLRDFESLNRNYLIPFFGDLYVYDIKSGMIKRYELEWKPVGNAKTKRQLNKSLDQLKSILKLAKELELIREIPVFPKTEKSKRKRAAIDYSTQEFILSNIQTHQAAFRLIRELMARPGEIRALKWKDIDYQNGVIHIRRHFSNKIEIEGRKSIKDPEHDFFDHTPPLTPTIVSILKELPRSIDGNEYIFKTRNGNPLYESALRKIWNKTIKELNLSHIDLYSALKRSTGQIYMENGAHQDQVRVLMGQSTIEATKHYTKENAKHLEGIVNSMKHDCQEKLTEKRERKW